jgi:YVTN family beta-propeller protein
MDLSRARTLAAWSFAALGFAFFAAGCGSVYRPVVTPINTNGPPPQPQSFAVTVSAPAPNALGVATIIDYSGDAVMAQAPIGPGPVSFTVDETGSTGYTYNSDGTLTNFQVSQTLQYKNLQFSTLVSGTDAINLYSPSAGVWVADNGTNGGLADILTGFPESFHLAVPMAPATAPVMVLGTPVLSQHNFVLNQNADVNGTDCNTAPTAVAANGAAVSIETSSDTISGTIPLGPATTPLLGQCPVYGVFSSDGKRLFVLNRGSDTVTVINAQNNTLDQCTPFTNQAGQLVTCHPYLPLSTAAVTNINAVNPGTGTPPNGTTGMGALAGPVYAEYNPATLQLVVANYDGGTISVIDVSLDEFGNDSSTFGTTYTIPVGKYPASVTVLADGSRAYTANQGDETVTIANLSSHTVEKTIPVTGHPRTVVSTQNSLFGKVYVSSPDSPYLTILRTDLDIVDTTILIEGNIVDVRVSSQNGSLGNTNNVSRIPGYGQPCNLPPGNSCLSSPLTIQSCQTLPTTSSCPAPASSALLRPASLK